MMVTIAQKRANDKYGATVPGILRKRYYGMVDRCTNPKNSHYKCYGARGIEVRFTVGEFVDYVMNELKQDPRGLTIDRIDSNGHYERDNIWFCTMEQNAAWKGRDRFKGGVLLTDPRIALI